MRRARHEGAAPAPAALLHLRIPAWAAAAAVPIALGNGTVVAGTPGTYLPVLLSALPATLSFSLPMAFAAALYTGQTAMGVGAQRYAITFGPTLLAATGPFTAIGNASCIVLPALDTGRVADWLLPDAAGGPLHFSVKGAPGVAYVPYFEIQEENFTAYPIFGAYE